MAKLIIIALVAAAALTADARAETYPERPVRVVVGFAAGTSADIAGRLVGQCLSERFGRQFIIENRPGAASSIATEAAMRSAPDGYTLLLVSAANVMNAPLNRQLKFNFAYDIVPVAGIVREPTVMEVHPSVPAATVAEFIAYAKANPGRINWGSSGVGTILHGAGALFQAMTGTDMVHIPYPANARPIAGLLAGEVQLMFGPIASSIEHIRAGKLRALGVTTANRSTALPDTPSVSEFVAGYEASNWYGIGLPPHSPAPIVERLNKEINACLADPRIRQRFADMGDDVMPMSPVEFGKLISAEADKYAKLAETLASESD